MARRTGRAGLSDIAQMTNRVVRSYGRRFAEEGDEQDLAELIRLVDTVESAAREAAQLLQARGGASWPKIGEALGVSGEAARKRWSGVSFLSGPLIYGLRRPGELGYFYVGQTKNLGLRVTQHRAMFGEFEAEVLERCGLEDLDRREQHWITTLRETGHPLVNTQPGGRRKLPEHERCAAVEWRATKSPRQLPRQVQCSQTVNHAGDCENNGRRFGEAEAEAEVRRSLQKMATYPAWSAKAHQIAEAVGVSL